MSANEGQIGDSIIMSDISKTFKKRNAGVIYFSRDICGIFCAIFGVRIEGGKVSVDKV